MSNFFDHEKLHVYQTAIEFVEWLQKILDEIPKKPVCDQLERASTSIPLNIAEGNGKFTPRDRCRFLDIARGSAFECASALDVLVAKGVLRPQEILPGKKILSKIVSMLVGLIKSNAADRTCEPQAVYECEHKNESGNFESTRQGRLARRSFHQPGREKPVQAPFVRHGPQKALAVNQFSRGRGQKILTIRQRELRVGGQKP